MPTKMRPYDSILPYERVEFPTYDGTTLRGNFYRSKATDVPAAIVIFCHGIGLLKEQYLENWFRHFLQAGYHVLSYDHRSFGHSDGVPRETFNWTGQAEDFVDAVTFATTRPEVRKDKVFAWGVAHAGGVIAMAAAMDKRIAGIMMFLPCIDGAWDKSRWGDWLWSKVQHNRFQQPTDANQSIKFWPLTVSEAAGTDGSVLSGNFVRDWSVVGQRMAEQGGNACFTGNLAPSSFWHDFNCRPADYLSRVSPTPLLWIMATQDVVCGSIEFTRRVYDGLQGPKEICILQGEHLPQYFDPGFSRSLEAMLSFLNRQAA